MGKFYLSWSDEKPTHPKDSYGVSWESGLCWYVQINPPSKSLDDWKPTLN